MTHVTATERQQTMVKSEEMVIYSWAERKVIGCISIYFVCRMSWAWVFFHQTTQFRMDKRPWVITHKAWNNCEGSEARNVQRDCMGLKPISCRKISWILKHRSFKVSLFWGGIGWMKNFGEKREKKIFGVCLIRWEERKINGEDHVFFLRTHQKVLFSNWKEN